jgi:hypothetical protein
MPVDMIHMDHRQAGTLAEQARQGALARARATDDHDAFYEIHPRLQ